MRKLLFLTAGFLAISLAYVYLRHGFTYEPPFWVSKELDLNASNTGRLAFSRSNDCSYEIDLFFPEQTPPISNGEMQKRFRFVIMSATGT